MNFRKEGVRDWSVVEERVRKEEERSGVGARSRGGRKRGKPTARR
jgi:hypothetical protein